VAVYAAYSVLLFGALVLFLPLYFIKLKVLRKERLFLSERLGFKLPKRKGENPFLWIHAVSVGEVLSLQSLVKEIRAAYPEWEIGFSTFTNTGYKMAVAKMTAVDHVFFVPFDFALSVRRFFRALRPRLLVLAESEFWPQLLKEAKRHSCSVVLVNGRISGRSFARFRRLRLLAGAIFKNISRFLVQTTQDKERLEKIGVPAERIEVSGNLKCETHLPALLEKDVVAFKKDLSIREGKKVVVAGSIHRGEEGPLLNAFREARKKRDDVLFVLAPRHPEKFQDFEKNFQGLPFVIRRLTSLQPGEDWDILILDTIGELARFYALSDLAFIGGSLIPRGGQNLLEPAFYGKPVFFGPHMENFAALVEEFVRGGGAKIVVREEDLVDMFLFKDPGALRHMGRQAQQILSTLQGATQKTLTGIESFMNHANKP
jgi:3-deoxy-D-manno-octulosonic-acid transferase